MASDHLHDKCVSKHGDARYTLLFVCLGPRAIVKLEKEWCGGNPKSWTKVVKENTLVETGFIVTFVSQWS